MAKLKEAEEGNDLIVYTTGLCYASVCTSLDDKKEIERRVNASHPTGTEGKWRVADEPFKTGTPNPCPCPDHEGRKHYLLSC